MPRQLPADVRGFVNRVSELARLDAMLVPASGAPETSVCVIAGTAGVGKTALALRWAHRHRADFPDGQLYVNLRGYDPGEPVTAMSALERSLTTLGQTPSTVPGDLETRSALYRSLLADRRMLILLDNAATVGQVRPLLPGAAGCVVVVTSRSRLSGLLIRDGAHRVTVGVFDEAEAVELLRVATAGYRIDDQEADVAELARLCVRLPLALRIAAERAAARPHMPLAALIRDLRDESSLWTALSSEDEEEADAVRTVFAWSYRALSASAARLFRLLGIHPGPSFGLPAAAALATVSPVEARRLLDVLVGAHLLEQSAHERYQFHDLLRAYASGEASGSDSPTDTRAALERLCDWYLRTLSAAVDALDAQRDPGLVVLENSAVTPLRFADPDAALEWIDTETDNLLAIAETAAGAGLDEMAWKLAALLRNPYGDRHPPMSWLPLGERALAAARRSDDHIGQIILSVGLGITHRLARDTDRAIEYHEAALAVDTDHSGLELLRENTYGHALVDARRFGEALEVYQRLLARVQDAGDQHWEVGVLGNMALILFHAGRLPEAQARIDDAFAAMPGDYSQLVRAEWLYTSAMIARESGRAAEAQPAIDEALSISREQKNLIMEAMLEIELANVQLALDRPYEALATLQHAASIHRRLGDRSREALALNATGEAYQAVGRTREAADFHRGAAMVHRELGDGWRLALALADLATVLHALGDSTEAASFATEALDLTRRYGDPRAEALRRRLTPLLTSSRN
ncbi:tetratricopeptide repeat protein [Phytohabitans kaempferiae]|uniref:Tetratricopeptide repeat protein n=1 Tax=Phytohabitans kaempferiae TaxID=1620943 RepID=A0ABV6LW45_9ACTN